MLRKNISISDSDKEGETAPQAAAEAATESAEQQLQARIDQLENDNRQLKDQALRALAEVENVRRRTQQEREQTVLYANERLLNTLLPIVDDFRRSVEAGEASKDFDSFYRGVSMIYDKILKMLDWQGVKRMDVVGQPFDVTYHEALMRQPSDAPEDTVIGELEPGYMYGDRVLRHAKVIVSAGS
jgi:molecular chaperone GrpE